MRFLLGSSVILLASGLAAPVAAQQHDQHPHEEEHSHDRGLHFTHPLLAESVSPDTKLRLGYGRRSFEQESESEVELEAEYAFHRAFSIEAGVHYHPETGDAGDTHVMLKLANYAFEEQGVLLGYGVEIGLPTGPGGHANHAHDHEENGHDHTHSEPIEHIYGITPFLNAGLLAGRWELVGRMLFSIPANQTDQQNVGTELRYHGSALYHVSPRLEALLEVHGRTGLSGPERDRVVLNLAPGLRGSPLPLRNLALGAAVSFPLTSDQEVGTRILVSAFYHF